MDDACARSAKPPGAAPLARRSFARTLGRGALALAAAPFAGPALVACSALPNPEPVQTVDGLTALRLADGVYAVVGASGAPEPANLGRIGNSGFIVGPGGVIAVDMGSSHAHGVSLLKLIAACTAAPVRVALITHTRPQFLFGGTAFQQARIPVRTHERTAQLMATRCDTCLKNLRLEVGDAPMRDTRLIVPDERFDASHTLERIGRPVRVLYFGASSGPGDIAVLDESSGVLFAGGLADNSRIPDIQDGAFEPWRRALDELRRLRVRQVVGGHGPVGGVHVLDDTRAYLDALEAGARELARAGTSLLRVPDALELPRFARWDQYDTIHRRNASIAFLRFEREALFQ